MTEKDHVDPVDFDIEAFVNGAVAATDRVEVSSRAGKAAELRDLLKQLKDADEKPGRAAAKRAEVKAIEEQIREVADALEGSWVEIEFTTPTPSQRRESFKGTTDDEPERRMANLLERVGRLRPVGSEAWQTLEASGWLRIFDVIGAGQYTEVDAKMANLAFTKGVTPGFSQRALSYLETRRSDKS
jgi:hypothetical protein